MREIKFRAWCNDTKRMLTDVSCDSAFLNEQLNDGMFHYLQYTGLKDKNEKSIFEGDLLSYENKDTRKVYWNDNDASYWVQNNNSNMPIFELFWPRKPVVEIIGNIYENVDLIE